MLKIANIIINIVIAYDIHGTLIVRLMSSYYFLNSQIAKLIIIIIILYL